MGENERDPQADLALCEAATRGPWESVSGYSVREPEDERGYGPIIANMDCKEHSVEQMVHNTCFICESREALPWYIRAYLAQREEIERLKSAALAEAHARVRDEVIGNLHHLGVNPHCDWQGHSVGQVVGCEVSALQMELEGVYAGIDQHGMEALNRQLQYQREEIDRLRSQLATQHNFQRGVECQFCGVSFDLPEPDDDGEVYRQHALTCEKSPVVQEVERLRKIIDDATGYSKDGDGTDLLCKALYGRPGKVTDWLGGSEARMLHDAAKEVERLRAENDRLREQSEESALARLRAWRAAAFGRWFNLENDVGCPDCLVLGELQGGGHQASRLVTASSDDEPHTEDKPASLGEMVTAALERWAELYGNQ